VCDAFARSYGKWRAGRVDNVDAYLRQAIVNAMRGGWRRRVVERRHAAALERQAVDDAHAPGFERRVVEREEVWDALRKLAPGQRRVVVLRYYEDLDEHEVARLLGVSVGTVKSQASKGLSALQRLLSKGES
jgi:RNA polymerase sigma factor (sigma-70 family)